MEEIRQKIKKIIEAEYRKALNAGILDTAVIEEKIWQILLDKNLLNIKIPEPAYGCYENTEEINHSI